MIGTEPRVVMNMEWELAASIIMHFDSLGQGLNAALQPHFFPFSLVWI